MLAENAIIQINVEKGKSVGDMADMHYHDYYEIYYVLSGERKHFVGDRLFTMQEGDLVAILPATPHKTGGKGAQRILISFSNAFIERWLTPRARDAVFCFFRRGFIRPAKEKRNELLTLFARMEKAQREKDEKEIFLAFLQVCTLCNEQPAAKEDGGETERLLQTALKYAQAHYADIDNLETVAKALYVSKYYLCHLFSKNMEMSFNRYLTEIRLKNASEFLKKTTDDVSDIALKCGFSTSTYFCQVFKRKFGYSPLQYRKLYAKEN